MIKKAVLEVTIDYAGNLVGKINERNSALTFSWLMDVVPDGGNYDGHVGYISALEIIEIQNKNSIVTEHPLEVIIFCNEEGEPVGSMAMSGGLIVRG